MPLICTHTRRLDMADMALIAGSPLAVRLLSNRLVLNNHAVLTDSEFRKFHVELTQWLAENVPEPYLFIGPEWQNMNDIIIGFSTVKSMIHCKLRFDCWFERG